ncbi:MAG: PaaI family thioesterase [Desulfobacteraceae bacterium]|nr:PaaI family thioesterase [Desulfobacteraceae bacterium]
MHILTHKRIDRTLVGKPLFMSNGVSRVELLTTAAMAADDAGLVHGGFIFGLADYAAMLAVNHPHVVLGGAEVKFLLPVRVDRTITAHAQTREISGKKHMVSVTLKCGDEAVFHGTFTCFVLDKHVLSP